MPSRLAIGVGSMTIIVFFAIMVGLFDALGEKPFFGVWASGAIAVVLLAVVAFGGMAISIFFGAFVLAKIEKRLNAYLAWGISATAFLITYLVAVGVGNGLASMNNLVEDRYHRYIGSFSE